jgi:hypothetical protein
MVMKKEVVEGQVTTKMEDALDLWNRRIEPIPIKRYTQEAENTEKMIIFSETFSGKTRFYLGILQYLQKKGIKKEDLLMDIIFPDRPNGLASLYGMIPKEYQDGVVNVFPVNNYEDTIIATATSVERLNNHYKKTGVHGWFVAELMESYWLYSQDFFCRHAYGISLMDYMTKMRGILNEKKANQGTAYEALAGPFGGPWPIIKMAHNMNWIDKLKKMPFNIVFTSEIKEEDNKESIFSDNKYRPAGEKHMQHKFDTIIYLTHRGDQYFMKPFKISGYEKLYGQLEITGKNGYEVHVESLKRLEKLGYKTTKMEELEKEAGITPPKPSEPKAQPQQTTVTQEKKEGDKGEWDF